MDGFETAGLDLEVMTAKVLEDVEASGLSDRTLAGYRAACNRIVALGRRRGTSAWTDELMREFLDDARGRVESGEVCASYGKLHERVARLMSSLAENGLVDLSWKAKGPRRYQVGDEGRGALGEILGGLSDGARTDVGTTVRHLLWFAEQDGLSPLEIDDAVLYRFLVEEVPATCPGKASRAGRAVRLTAAWVASKGGLGVRRDWSTLSVGDSPSRLLPSYSEAEIRAIVGSIDDTTVGGRRDKAIILLAYCTGLRGIDIRRLRLSDIDWRRQTLTVLQSKTGKPVTCVLNGETANAIADYVLHARPECDAPEVFLTLRAPYRPIASRMHGMLDRRCESAGVEKLAGRAFHGIRRSFETTLVSKGVPLDTVSEMVGHGSVEQDRPYITFDRERAGLVAMGLDDVPLTAGAYASTTPEGAGL